MALEVQLLQVLCFWHIINTLEEFPPNALALLPSDIRFSMLTSLPLVDVCRLELTLFITGLDMEKVWEHLYKKYLDLQVLANFKPGPSWKWCLLSRICTIIINDKRPYGYFQLMTRAHKSQPWTVMDTTEDRPISELPLDSVNFLVAMRKEDVEEKKQADYDDDDDEEYYYRLKYGPTWKSMECHEVTKQKGILPPSPTYHHRCQSQMIIPKRYRHLFATGSYFLPDATAISLLSKECNFYPQSIDIVCSRFSTFLQRQSNTSGLVRLFNELASLSLTGDEDKQLANVITPGVVKNLEQIPETIFGFILANPMPKFSSLTLHIRKGTDEIIPSIAPILSNAFSNLKEFHLHAHGSVSPNIHQLIKITENQTSIERVTISITDAERLGGSFDPPVRKTPKISLPLVISWAKLCFTKPSFKHLVFTVPHLTAELLQLLVVSFLSMPCTHDQTLKLSLRPDRSMAFPPLTSSSECDDISDTCTLSYKCLVLNCYSPLPFYQWLFGFHPLKLKQVYIIDQFLYSEIFPSLTRQATFDFESLTIDGMYADAAEYKALLLKPSLKYLHFHNCKINFSAFAEGLRQESVSGKLLELNISNTLGWHGEAYTNDDAGLRAFFNSLFSLPHLPQFTFKLLFNLGPGQLQMMYSEWEERGKVQLKSLSIRVPESTTDSDRASLLKMAVEVHFED